MIAQVMKYINNHFWYSRERDTFAFSGSEIEGTFAQTYVVGQYIHVLGSFLNDGVYKLTAVSSTKLTVDATLQDEDTVVISTIFGCKVPNDFLSIVTDIDSWVAENAGKEGISSESIDSYSFSFATDSAGNTANTWKVAFGNRLTPYKQVFEEFDNYGYKGLL